MPFQSKINLNPAKGWHGDFASTNTRVSVFNSGEVGVSAYAVGEKGILAGSFVWFDETSRTLNNFGSGCPDGFVGRELTGITIQYLQENNMRIPHGFMATAYEKGEFMVELAEDMGTVARRSSVFVDPNTGLIVDASATGAVETNYKYENSGKGGDLVAITAWM